MVILHNKLEMNVACQPIGILQILADHIFVDVLYSQMGWRNFERVDIVLSELLGHDLSIRPGRNRHPAQAFHTSNNLHTIVHGLTAAVAGDSEALHQFALIGKDERFEHIGRNT